MWGSSAVPSPATPPGVREAAKPLLIGERYDDNATFVGGVCASALGGRGEELVEVLANDAVEHSGLGSPRGVSRRRRGGEQDRVPSRLEELTEQLAHLQARNRHELVAR